MQDSSGSVGRGGKSEKVLVYPYDIRIPKVRISTRQAEDLKHHRLEHCGIDSCGVG
jgi:DIS3-like exonuclease 1